jgi:hypothetical protein
MRVNSLSAALLSLVLAGCISQAEGTPPTEPQAAAASSSKARIKIQPLSNATPNPQSLVASRQTLVSSSIALPPAVLLEVPFTSQAPFKNWDEPYQNACEEASLLTVMHYLENRPFTQELANREIVDLASKTAAMGYGISISMQQLADITRALYPQYEPVIHTDVSVESLKKLLAQGKPVIIPAAGKELKNPYFSGGGPWYHMLVVTGYDATYFYTNDVGTGHGERYPYPQQMLIDIIHDWTGQDETIGQGRKVMMTLEQR